MNQNNFIITQKLKQSANQMRHRLFRFNDIPLTEIKNKSFINLLKCEKRVNAFILKGYFYISFLFFRLKIGLEIIYAQL